LNVRAATHLTVRSWPIVANSYAIGENVARMAAHDPHLPFDRTRVLRQLPKWNSHSGLRFGRQILGVGRHSGIRVGEAAKSPFSDIRTLSRRDGRLHSKRKDTFDPQ